MNSFKAVSRLSLLREERGITQLALARSLEVTENSVANWEHGRSGIEWFVRIAALCEIFQCDPKDLFECIPCEVPEPDSQNESILESIRRSIGTTKQSKIKATVKNTSPTIEL